jgi:hypothetical protein
MRERHSRPHTWEPLYMAGAAFGAASMLVLPKAPYFRDNLNTWGLAICLAVLGVGTLLHSVAKDGPTWKTRPTLGR